MSVAAGDYLAARIKVMVGRLLPLKALHKLIELDLEQIHVSLQQQLPGYVPQPSAAAQKRQLNMAMYSDFKTLLTPLTSVEQRFIKHALRWFELVNLKAVIRGKFTGVPEAELTRQLVNLGEYADLPTRELIETDDPFEMLRSLEQTAYGGIVRQARKVFEEQGQDLFSLDAAIDRSFFIEMTHRARFLDQATAASLKSVLGALLDRFNLLWLMRYRFSYGLTPAKSYYLLTATGNTLHSAQLLKLAQVGSVAELIEQLPPKLNQLLAGQQDIYHIEQIMELYSLSAARACFRPGHSLMAMLFSYLVLREAETRFLCAITKGKELGFDQKLIERAVVNA
jgi:V/A-type H+-transporting ATPase subunit C